MPRGPFLILDTPRGPDGACWFVANRLQINDAVVERLSTDARSKRDAGQPLVGNGYVAVAHPAIQILKERQRQGHELLILAGLGGNAVGLETGIQTILNQKLIALAPMSGQIINGKSGSTGILRSSDQVLALEKAVLDEVASLTKAAKIRSSAHKSGHLFTKLLVVIMAIVLGVTVIRMGRAGISAVGGYVVSVFNQMTAPAPRDSLQFMSEGDWGRIAKVAGMPDSVDHDQRLSFARLLYREICLFAASDSDVKERAIETEMPKTKEPAAIEFLGAAQLVKGDPMPSSLSQSYFRVLGSDSSGEKQLRLFIEAFIDTDETHAIDACKCIRNWQSAICNYVLVAPSEALFKTQAEGAKNAFDSWPLPIIHDPKIMTNDFLTVADGKRILIISSFLNKINNDLGPGGEFDGNSTQGWINGMKKIVSFKRDEIGGRPVPPQFTQLIAEMRKSIPSHIK